MSSNILNFLFCCIIKKDISNKENPMTTSSQVDKLKNCDHEKIPLFSFENKRILARIVDIYDGDTCTIIFEYNGEIIKYKLRCMGYDCAEMKPKKDDPTRDEQKRLALLAKNRFTELIGGLNAVVHIKCLEFDKYGRILGNVYHLNDDPDHDESVNTKMIKEGHGKPYDGGTKDSW